jgi:hypothetical protein
MWSRLDIVYAVSELSKHMQCPSKAHHFALKHVLIYLSNTVKQGIRQAGRQAGMIGFITLQQSAPSQMTCKESPAVQEMPWEQTCCIPSQTQALLETLA